MDAKKSERLANAFTYICLGIATIVFLFPFLWMIGTAFKTMSEAMSWPPKIFPSVPQFSNFTDIFKGTVLLRSMLNSAIVTVAA
jgi:multiple sugar transport system permease protein